MGNIKISFSQDLPGVSQTGICPLEDKENVPRTRMPCSPKSIFLCFVCWCYRPSPTKLFHKQQKQQSLFLCVFASSVPYIPFTSSFRGFLYPQIVWPSEGSSGAWCENKDPLTGHLAVASWSRLLLPFSSAEVLIWILLLSQPASFQWNL